jgi:hypothetical protein
MDFLKKLTFATAACLFLLACNTPPPVNRFDKMAEGFCECTAQLAALNQQAVKLAEDTTGKAAVIFHQMQEEYGKAKDCSASIVSQFGKLKKEEMPQMIKALSGKCPDLATQGDLLQEMLGE